MSQIKTIKDVDLKGKKVFVRVDFNVPFDNTGAISDDTRIVAALPTLKYLLDEGASLVLASHLGRPKSKEDKQFSLAPVAKALSEKLGKPVTFVDDCIGEKVKEVCSKMTPGDVVLLENSRFYPEEKKNNPEFAKKLIEDKQLYLTEVLSRTQDFLIQLSGVKDVYTSQRIRLGAWTPGINKLRNAYNPQTSGDILIQVAPGWRFVNEDTGENYIVGTGYIPFPVIFFGYGIKPEEVTTLVTVDYIAPTLSKAMRIRAPNACFATPLL